MTLSEKGKPRGAGLTVVKRAEIALGLVTAPKSDITAILKKAKLKQADALLYLRNSVRPEAAAMLDKFDKLSLGEKKGVTLDMLIASAGVDPSTALAVITEEAHRQSANVATLIMAGSHQKVTEATVKWAQRVDGYQDRKLLHQSMSTTPVPKNQTTFVDARGANMSKTQVNINAPSMNDIVRTVDAVLHGTMQETL